MKGFDISNSKLKGLTPLDLYKNRDINAFRAGGTLTEVLIPMYKDLLCLALGNDVDKTFYDKVLSKQQTEQIQTIFEEQIDLHIPKMETKLPYDNFIEWKGKKYEMNLRLHSPINRRIMDFYKIISICKECLAENKPMYLSIV